MTRKERAELHRKEKQEKILAAIDPILLQRCNKYRVMKTCLSRKNEDPVFESAYVGDGSTIDEISRAANVRQPEVTRMISQYVEAGFFNKGREGRNTFITISERASIVIDHWKKWEENDNVLIEISKRTEVPDDGVIKIFSVLMSTANCAVITALRIGKHTNSDIEKFTGLSQSQVSIAFSSLWDIDAIMRPTETASDLKYLNPFFDAHLKKCPI